MRRVVFRQLLWRSSWPGRARRATTAAHRRSCAGHAWWRRWDSNPRPPACKRERQKRCTDQGFCCVPTSRIVEVIRSSTQIVRAVLPPRRSATTREHGAPPSRHRPSSVAKGHFHVGHQQASLRVRGLRRSEPEKSLQLIAGRIRASTLGQPDLNRTPRPDCEDPGRHDTQSAPRPTSIAQEAPRTHGDPHGQQHYAVHKPKTQQQAVSDILRSLARRGCGARAHPCARWPSPIARHRDRPGGSMSRKRRRRSDGRAPTHTPGESTSGRPRRHSQPTRARPSGRTSHARPHGPPRPEVRAGSTSTNPV